jgi:hypothetical protein
LLLVAMSIIGALGIILSLRRGDSEFFVRSLIGTALPVSILILWALGTRTSREAA